MPLFRRQDGQLTWQDVKEFLDRGIPENELLDYKEQCPKYIEPTMAAMANTFGGDITIGVGEEADGIPKATAKVVGVPDAGGLKQAIEQKNFSIHPPILGLHVEAVPIPEAAHPDHRGDRAVVVVRVRQSDLVPHFVPRQGHFGRAGSHRRAYTDEHLTTARIEWLMDRRRRHVEFREELLSWVDFLQYSIAWHKVWCVPQFPSPDGPLWEGRGDELGRTIPRAGMYNQAVLFLYPQFQVAPTSRSIQHGVVWRAEHRHVVELEAASGTEAMQVRPSLMYLVEDRGLVALKGISHEEVSTAQTESTSVCQEIVVDWTVVATHLLGVCHHASALYEASGYGGPVEIGIEIGVAHDVPRLDVFLGQSIGPTRLNTGSRVAPVMWQSTVYRLSTDPMSARGRRVSDTRECAASSILDAAREMLVASKWTRAFNHDMPIRDSEAGVAHIEDAMKASAE